jgi:hypothetical protein
MSCTGMAQTTGITGDVIPDIANVSVDSIVCGPSALRGDDQDDAVAARRDLLHVEQGLLNHPTVVAIARGGLVDERDRAVLQLALSDGAAAASLYGWSAKPSTSRQRPLSSQCSNRF